MQKEFGEEMSEFNRELELIKEDIKRANKIYKVKATMMIIYSVVIVAQLLTAFYNLFIAKDSVLGVLWIIVSQLQLIILNMLIKD